MAHDLESHHYHRHHLHHPFAWLFVGLFLRRVGAGTLVKGFLAVLALGAVILATTGGSVGFVATTLLLLAVIFWWARR